MVAVLAGGCGQPPEQNACPPLPPGIVPANGTGIEWRSDGDVAALAVITRVAVECIPNRHEAVRTTTAQLDAFTDYGLAATATVKYTVFNSTWLESRTRSGAFDAAAMFEAVSESEVVLGSDSASLTLEIDGTETTLSAQIPGLSDEELRRVSVVRVRWRYGDAIADADALDSP